MSGIQPCKACYQTHTEARACIKHPSTPAVCEPRSQTVRYHKVPGALPASTLCGRFDRKVLAGTPAHCLWIALAWRVNTQHSSSVVWWKSHMVSNTHTCGMPELALDLTQSFISISCVVLVPVQALAERYTEQGDALSAILLLESSITEFAGHCPRKTVCFWPRLASRCPT